MQRQRLPTEAGMIIRRVLNNNVVVVLDVSLREQIIMGRGIGFQKRHGDVVEPAKIEKIFALQDNQLSARLSELFSQIPLSIITACDQIIALASQALGSLHESIAVTLIDHCHLAIERKKQGIFLKNSLLWEIQQFYPKEYAMGLQALDIFSERLNIDLSQDEAGFIALHLVTAQLNGGIEEAVQAPRLMQEILQIVRQYFQLEYQHNSLCYQRFVTHLKFFTQRMLNQQLVDDDDPEMQMMVKGHYLVAWQCAQAVAGHLVPYCQRLLSGNELMYLALHIEKVRKASCHAA